MFEREVECSIRSVREVLLGQGQLGNDLISTSPPNQQSKLGEEKREFHVKSWLSLTTQVIPQTPDF